MLDFIKNQTPIVICDIGAAEIDTHQDKIKSLSEITDTIIYGFEPNEDEFNKIKQSKKKIIFNTALGDGTKKKFNYFSGPGMNSCLEPDYDYLNLFHGFDLWTKFLKKTEIKTEKLDSIKFDHKIDFFKIDSQGMENEIIEYGKSKIKDALCVEVETSPTPIYNSEKPFSYVSKQLEDLGYSLHLFKAIHTRPFKPMTFVKNNPWIGLHHVFQLDCLFIKNIKFLLKLDTENLRKIILILYYCYESFDLVYILIAELEKRLNKNLLNDYKKIISQKKINKIY